MFGKEKKAKRFRLVMEEGLGLSAARILVDTETGVNYLNIAGDVSQGITPLLDAEGKVVITPLSELKTEE